MAGTMRRVLVTTILLGLTAGGWYLLAPRQVPGGAASYVVPSGSSMLPHLDGDDLVVVREAPGYLPGDVVAYHSVELQRIVLHRIVRREGDRYVLKGDNNTWIDRDRPTQDRVLGRTFVRIPGGGAALAWIRTPRNAAVVGTVVGVVLTGGLVGARVRRRRRRRRSDAPAPTRRPARPAHGLRVAAVGAGVTFLGFGAVAAYVHLRPETRTVPTRVTYDHEGSFGYVALAEPGAVYPDGQVDAGEPVFLRLTDHVSVRFIYRFSTDRPHAVGGTVSLAADLEDGTGWRRSFPLQPPTPFAGDEAVVTGTLDLAKIGSLIRRVEEATEIARPAYTLTLLPSVEVEGTLATRPVYGTFAPQLALDANPLLLRLPAPDDPEKEPTDVLSVRDGGSVLIRNELPNTVALGPVQLQLAAARRLSLIGLGVSGLLFLVIGALAIRRHRTEPARIHARYGQRIVPVATEGLDGPVVDVATIGALVRVADTYERMILHEERGGAHSYMVEGDVALYRYRTDAARAQNGSEPDNVPLQASAVEDAPAAPPPVPVDPESETEVPEAGRPVPQPTPFDPSGRLTPASDVPSWPLEQRTPSPVQNGGPTSEAPPADGPPAPTLEPDDDWLAGEEWWLEEDDDLVAQETAAPLEEDDLVAQDPAAPPGAEQEDEEETPGERMSRLAQDFFFSS